MALPAIVTRAPISKRLMKILGGEFLLDDASSLLCMGFAVAVTPNGDVLAP
jgi:NhaP-type Na+/H+ or K+/H+ antiporter